MNKQMEEVLTEKQTRWHLSYTVCPQYSGKKKPQNFRFPYSIFSKRLN